MINITNLKFWERLGLFISVCITVFWILLLIIGTYFLITGEYKFDISYIIPDLFCALVTISFPFAIGKGLQWVFGK